MAKSLNKPGSRAPALAAHWLIVCGGLAQPEFASAQLPMPGLPVPAANWVGAGQATREIAGNAMTIRQHSDKAVLNWQSFDIGRDQAVRFRQPDASSIALNRIAAGTEPSRILGRLDANGQVYLLNPNGIVFGENARVNVNTLVATTLNVSEEALDKGLTKAINQSQGTVPVAALTGGGQVFRKDEQGRTVLGADGKPLKIAIETLPGAALKTNAKGGRIILAAPSIRTAGTISAPDGQVVLAAATDKVYLQEADPQSNLRGILVEVGTGGDVANLGTITAARGNVTAVGYALAQQGRVSATTSVNLNGTVRLLAREGAKLERTSDGAIHLVPGSTRRSIDNGDGLGTQATAVLAGGSETRVKLDASGGKAVDEQTQNPSQIEITGGKIVAESGARLAAPGGKVALTASENPAHPMLGTSAQNGSRIVLRKGSRIDVAGSRSTVLPMERNVVSVELRNYELRDSPIQKTGLLHGQTVQVDIRKGTPLADISGATARIRRSVDERQSSGGSVALASEGDVLFGQHAVVDVSGGTVRYRDGWINTTQVVSDGRTYDISKADPNRHYDGVMNLLSRAGSSLNLGRAWSLPALLAQGRYEPGYTEGRAAGSFSIQARNVELDGTVVARTVTGRYQRTVDQRPAGGQISIDLAWSGQAQQDVVLRNTAAPLNLLDEKPFPGVKTGTGLPDLVLSRELFRGGLQKLAISSTGRITVDSGTALTLPDWGSLSLAGGAIAIDGAIAAPAGNIALNTKFATGDAAPLSGDIRLGAAASLDTSGRWVNDRPGSHQPLDPVALPIAGGQASAQSVGKLVLEPGSRIAADGGAWLPRDGKLQSGAAGRIALGVAGIERTRLDLGARLSAYGLETGGSLAITANALRIGASSAATDPASTVLSLTSEFLQSGGFKDIALTANGGGLAVEAGTVLNLRTLTRQLDRGNFKQPTGGHLADFSRTVLQPEYFRKPAELTLNLSHDAKVAALASGNVLSLGEGARITTDPGGRIALSSDTSLRIDGTLSAPAGQIELAINPVTTSLDKGYDPDQAIRLGPLARLLAPGAVRLKPNVQSLALGDVDPGGKVALNAYRGFVLMDPAAVIDVSGAAARLDIAGKRGAMEHRRIGSDGGTIAFTAAEGILPAGTLLGRAGDGPGAKGGTLGLTLDAQQRGLAPENLPVDALPIPVGPRVLHLAAHSSRTTADGVAWNGAIPGELNGQAYFGANQVAAGGFASLQLAAAVLAPGAAGTSQPVPQRGSIRFDGDLNLTLGGQLFLDAPVLEWSRSRPEDSGTVTLTSSYVALGSSLNREGSAGTSAGDGKLRIDADWIDALGSTELQGFRETRLTSRNDIRLRGVNPNREGDLLGRFAAAGEIGLAARQIYPGTLSRFSIRADAAEGGGGLIRLLPGGRTAAAPLSAGGSVTLSAARIESLGVLRAPLGTIELQAEDTLDLAARSLTSVSGKGLSIPFGRTQGGLDWLFPLGAYDQVLSTPPEKSIALEGREVHIREKARLDLSGGGKLLGFEFIKGPGGSVDQLDPTDPGYADGTFSYQEKYAVVPWLGSRHAPYDPIDTPVSGLSVGDSIYLGPGSGLPAGRYALLPAHYALLPGAFLVTPEAGTTDLPAGRSYPRMDGSPVVAGYRYTAGTSYRDARWSGFAVEPGTISRTRSEYRIDLANGFYAKQAAKQETAVPRLPRDAGSLAIGAGSALELAGDIAAQGRSGGRGGRLDIAAANLKIVQTRAEAAAGSGNGSAVTLAADDLNRLSVESLLIGGRRREEADSTRLNLEASEVSVAPGARLAGQEILLAAKTSVAVGDGASLTARGKAPGEAEKLKVGAANGRYTGGALLRISAGNQAEIGKDALASGNPTGVLDVGAGATLRTDGSLYLSSTVDTRLRGEIRMDAGALALEAGRISLGEAPGNTAGLLLGESLLNRLKVDELRLVSLSSVDLFGPVDFQAKRLTVDSGGLRGQGALGDTARIAADSVSFSNSGAAAGATAASGRGGVSVEARRIKLGPGTQTWSGFRDVALSAADALVASGNSSLGLDGNLRIAAGKLAAESGAALKIDAGERVLSITRLAGGKPASVADGLGASLAFSAGTVAVAAPISLPAGSLSVTASGDLTLAKGAAIDAGGRAAKLGGTTVYAPGGTVSLSSAAGNVALAAGAGIDVAADPGGGNAGRLKIAAGSGRTLLDGMLKGQAGKNGEGGAFSLDTTSLAAQDFSSLNAKLAAAGFDRSLTLRLRQGDVLVNSGDMVKAHEVHLTADSGNVTVLGNVDANGSAGGLVRLEAGRSVALEPGARVLANANPGGGDGGQVELSALGEGNSASGVRIAAGARIEVSPGAGGQGGSVAARVAQAGGGDAAVDIAARAVIGAASRTVEAVRIYRDVPLTNAGIAAWRDDAASFMDAAAGNAALQARLGGFTLTPGLEIQASGDLNLGLAESLAGKTWTPAATANVWTTRLDDVAGAVTGLSQIAPAGTARTLTPGSSSALTANGSFYFDADPASATFRQLFVRAYPNSGIFDPAQLKDTLVEANGWDFALPNSAGESWRFGAEQVPGTLTVRATGDLAVSRSLSDAFVTYGAESLARFFQFSGAAPSWLDTQMLQPGQSWSYRLAAGADLRSADALATAVGATGDLVIGAGAAVRTGTGSIEAAAGRDIRLTDTRSAIYTAGRPTDVARYGSFDLGIVSRTFYAEYPVEGGDLSLRAGRNVIGAATPQFMSDWLVRTGSWNPADGIGSQDRATAWGIGFDGLVVANSANSQTENLKFGFRENVGALGGGKITVDAGGDVRDLSAMLPSTAKPVGATENGTIVENRWQLEGGGELSVTAGGDIAGGVFYVDRGRASLMAGGSVAGGSQYAKGPVFGLGDAQFQVAAGRGIAVGTVVNPFSVTAPKYTDKRAYFTTYSGESAISFLSIGGDLVLNSDASDIQREYKVFDNRSPNGRSVFTSNNEVRMLTLFPGTLGASALSGGLSIAHSFDLFPAPSGDLALLAEKDIHFDTASQVVVNQSDTDPSLLLPASTPAVSLNDTVKRLDIFNPSNTAFLHAADPVHRNDGTPVRIASETGSILANHASIVSTAEATLISAGRDIAGLGLELQNIAAGDVSSVRAGRDLRFPILRNALTGQLDSSIDDLPISVAGPGLLQVTAGRNVDLGTSAGITSVGSLTNPALSSRGANISVWAGLNREPDYQAFIKAYLGKANGYGDALTKYLRAMSGDSGLSRADALSRFKALPEASQQEFILAVLFRELKAAGIAAARQTDAARRARFYRRGEKAVSTLFPGSDYQGDIKLFFSRIQTLAGGDISLLAPGGLIDVGLASAFSGSKTAADLGIVAQGQGNIGGLARGDVAVNESRVFTLGGGDITVWSERGDIDAGRGAKAALAAPAPIYAFDAKGNLVVTFPPSVSGSGIRAQSGSIGTDFGADATRSPLTMAFASAAKAAARYGDVTLVAPRGVVNAGEAGIGGRNVAIAATAIIGLNNIQAGASLTGAPPPAPNLTAVMSGASNLTAAVADTAEAALNDHLAAASEQVAKASSSAPVNLIRVDLLGFGECSAADIRQGGVGCK